MKISNETKVGSLTVIAITVLIIGYNFLKGKDLFTNTVDYYAKYENINGIKVSNAILYNGFNVGKVTSLDLNENGEVIYVGKANNIKQRVLSHFHDKGKKEIAMCEHTTNITYEITGSELVARIKYEEVVSIHKPKHNRNKKLSIESVTFNHENMILVDKGRISSEKSVILIENNQYQGYAYAELQHQINNLDILKTLINSTENYPKQNMIIKKYLSGNKVEKMA